MSVGAETPPAFDATDQHALRLALRAIKMTEPDLSFSKTNVESELVLAKTRVFLQQPLALPVYGQSVLSRCASAESLRNLAEFARELLDQAQPRTDVEPQRISLDPEFLAKLPVPLAHAVERFIGVCSVSRLLLEQALPAAKDKSFAAFAVDTFSLGKDRAELDRWQQAGIDTTRLHEIVQRDDALELQDTELADAILAASDKFDEPRLMAAFE